ncbi:MAG: hypothetical protein ACLRRT_08690 [Ruthenibacterium lactatiformans]
MAGKAGLLKRTRISFGKVFLVDSSYHPGKPVRHHHRELLCGERRVERQPQAFNLSTAFSLCMLFSPLFLMIPGAATGSALIVVGISMETLRDVGFQALNFCGLMLLVTAYKGDYVAGIALGMFTYRWSASSARL